MEPNQYLKILKTNLIFVAILVLVGAFLGFYSSHLLPSGYKQSQVFFVSQILEDKTKSSGFAQPEAVGFTDSAVSILESQDFLLSTQISQSSVEVKKLANQVLKITVSSETEEQSKKDLASLVSNFNDKVSSFLGDNEVQLTPVGSSPQASYFALSSKVLALFGALLGLMSALALLALASYFKL